MITIDAVDACLPQTQCGECGFPGCRPYAEALVNNQAPIDQCPPGGLSTIIELAKLLHQDPSPYLNAKTIIPRLPALASIREAECIGCTKCIQACPVDAIIGTAKHMHSVIAHECTGCGLCVEPCPVDCIDIQVIPQPVYDKNLARERHRQRHLRLLRQQQEKEAHYQTQRLLAAETENKQIEKKAKQDYILQALSRVNAKRRP
jgi:electron transport complex protein RnfB